MPDRNTIRPYLVVIVWSLQFGFTFIPNLSNHPSVAGIIVSRMSPKVGAISIAERPYLILRTAMRPVTPSVFPAALPQHARTNSFSLKMSCCWKGEIFILLCKGFLYLFRDRSWNDDLKCYLAAVR